MGQKRNRCWIGLAASISLAGLVGCGSPYYRVTDNTSGEVYYTQKADMTDQQGGELKLIDARTNSTITLTDSSVENISREEYRGATTR